MRFLQVLGMAVFAIASTGATAGGELDAALKLTDIFPVHTLPDDVSAAKQLVTELHEADPRRRIQAAVDLGGVLEVLDDRCLPAFGQPKDPELLRRLREIVHQTQNDKDPVVRGLLAIGKASGIEPAHGPDVKAALPILLAAWEAEDKSPLPATESTRSQLRFQFIALLGRFGPEAVPALPRLLKELSQEKEIPTGICGQHAVGADRCDAVLTAWRGIGRTVVPRASQGNGKSQPHGSAHLRDGAGGDRPQSTRKPSDPARILTWGLLGVTAWATF